ncbi:MAG: hypothetical protein CL811_10885 [Colwelliaceae bacterium]|nr:hypothetical protein [Colwelliaceae bacterium]
MMTAESLVFEHIKKDKNLYSTPQIPALTVYDDNWFVRNDYDVLSVGQRNYVINYLTGKGFKQKSGRSLVNGDITVHFPRPQSNLAVSAFQPEFVTFNSKDYYCLTPTQFAEALCYRSVNIGLCEQDLASQLKQLIDKCPYNIEWLRDISYRTIIESITAKQFSELMAYQAEVVKAKFKMKKAL